MQHFLFFPKSKTKKQITIKYQGFVHNKYTQIIYHNRIESHEVKKGFHVMLFNFKYIFKIELSLTGRINDSLNMLTKTINSKF